MSIPYSFLSLPPSIQQKTELKDVGTKAAEPNLFLLLVIKNERQYRGRQKYRYDFRGCFRGQRLEAQKILLCSKEDFVINFL